MYTANQLQINPEWQDNYRYTDYRGWRHRACMRVYQYHGESGVRTLRELSRSYLAASKDLTRVMNRLKAIYRSWAIPRAGQEVYSPRHRAAWLEKLRKPACDPPG